MPAAAHHTGVYAPKDNAITTNFRDVKFSVQAGKFDVALRRFDEGPLRAEMRAGGIRVQAMLTAVPIELNPARAPQVHQALGEFRAMGFELEPFGAATLLQLWLQRRHA